MPYIDPVKWESDHVDPKGHTFHDTDNTIASFHHEVFDRPYSLGPPKRILSLKCFKETLSKSNYKEVVKSWLEDPTLVIPASLPIYPISWFREPFSLLEAIFFKLYGLPNCSSFREQWVPMAQHIFLTGDSFNWAQILSCNLRDEIQKYQKTSAN